MAWHGMKPGVLFGRDFESAGFDLHACIQRCLLITQLTSQRCELDRGRDESMKSNACSYSRFKVELSILFQD